MDATAVEPLPVTTVLASDPHSSSLVAVLLQISHRLAVVALLAMIGTVASIALGKSFTLPLAAAVGGADVAVCLAVLVLSLNQRRREAMGLVWFNGVLIAAGVVLMLVARLDVIGADLKADGTAVREQVQVWMTPTAPVP